MYKTYEDFLLICTEEMDDPVIFISPVIIESDLSETEVIEMSKEKFAKITEAYNPMENIWWQKTILRYFYKIKLRKSSTFTAKRDVSW